MQTRWLPLWSVCSMWFVWCMLALSPGLAWSAAPTLRAALSGSAREAFDRGTDLYARGQYVTAREAFVEAHSASREPRVLYNVAVCDKALGRYHSAIDTLRASVAEPATLPPAYLQLTADTLAVLERKLAHVRVETNVDAELFVDGNPTQSPVTVDPGRHVFEARSAGHLDAREAIDASEGQSVALRLVLRAVPTAPLTVALPARLRVSTSNSSDRIRLDGVLQPQHRIDVALPAGEHHLEIHRDDAEGRELELLLRPGETRDLRVALTERGSRKIWPWVVGGASVLVVSAATLAAILVATSSTQYVGASPGVLAPGVVTANVPLSGGSP